MSAELTQEAAHIRALAVIYASAVGDYHRACSAWDEVGDDDPGYRLERAVFDANDAALEAAVPLEAALARFGYEVGLGEGGGFAENWACRILVPDVSPLGDSVTLVDVSEVSVDGDAWWITDVAPLSDFERIMLGYCLACLEPHEGSTDDEGYVVCDGGCGNAATTSDEAGGFTFHLCDDCIDSEVTA